MTRPQTATVELWRRRELSFDSIRDRVEPDIEVDLIGRFTGPDGTEITLPGFWDGGRTWRIRFAPTACGTWHYEVTSSDPDDTGLRGEGSFEAVPNSRDTDLDRHGFVTVSADRRGFVHADGAAFLWLGDTHWQAPDYERLHACNDPAAPDCTSQFARTVDADVARGFTVYQTYPDAVGNDGGGNLPQARWWTPDGRLDPTAFRRQFDPMMDLLADRGLVVALGAGVHWQSGRAGVERMVRFTRHLVARYAAHPVVWITGQEVDVENGLGTLPVWRAVAETIAELDGYHHPLGAHMDSVGEPTTFGDEPWHDWFPTQGGHLGLRTQAHYRHYWERDPVKPFLETEASYEGIAEGIPASQARRAAWRAVQCGSRGYTYGAAGVWAIKWDHESPGWDDYQNGIAWYEGIRLTGGDQMTHLKRFYEAIDGWHSLIPRFSDPAFGEFSCPEHAVLSSSDHQVVVYFSDDSTATGRLRGLDPRVTYRMRWFDPRSGEYVPIDIASVADDGSWTVPDRPCADDWALLIEPAA